MFDAIVFNTQLALIAGRFAAVTRIPLGTFSIEDRNGIYWISGKRADLPVNWDSVATVSMSEHSFSMCFSEAQLIEAENWLAEANAYLKANHLAPLN